MNETSASLHITALPAFSDNYLWLIEDGQHAVIVDPGDAAVVQAALQQRGLILAAILLTHHHADHTGGAETLQRDWQCQVYAPHSAHMAYQAVTATRVGDGDTVHISSMPALSFQVLALPGHTLDHLAYLLDQTHLFCGDVLFGAGCGRLFEGTAAQMYASLQTLAALPETTSVYPAHEYTSKNIAFALSIDTENVALQQRAQQTALQRAQGYPSLPSTIKLERQTNPFLRCEQLTQRGRYQGWQPLALFTELRRQRNDF